jgi:hypothetical protein
VRVLLYVLLSLAAPAVFSQTAGVANAADAATSPTAIIARCSEEDTEAIGVKQLESPCPGIEHALVEFGYAPFLSEAQFDALTTYGLVDLQYLAERYTPKHEAPSAPDLDVGRLDSILHSIEEPTRAQLQPGLFERLKQWLRKVFDKQAANPGSWLNRWLPDLTLPEAVSKALGYLLIGIVIAIAIGVFVNELRAAGVLKRSAGSRRDRNAGTDESLGLVMPASRDLDALPLRERPSMLLRMLVATLVQTGRLRTERSLTHRELGTRAALDEQAQRECFQRVAALGERTLYGGGSVPAGEIESVVAAGRSLNAQLLATTGKA